MFDMQLSDNLFYSNIYFTSSRRARIVIDDQKYENQKDDILNSVDSIERMEGMESQKWPDGPGGTLDITNGTDYIDSISNFMIVYAASKIEKKIMECNTFHCNRCRSVFNENEKIDTTGPNHHNASHFSNSKPCKSTVAICKTAEQFFKLYDGHKSKPRYDFKVLYCFIFRAMNFSKIYPNSEFECDSNHKYQFMKCIVGQYISMRATQLAKQTTFRKTRSDRLATI